MKKLNSILSVLVIVFGFLTLNLFLADADDTLGYAERIGLIEAKINNHETRISTLESKPITTSTTSTNTDGQWQDLDGNQIFLPNPDTVGWCSASSHKFHYWEGCQFYAPLKTWEEWKKIYPDAEPCILCMKHLVPPGAQGVNKAPSKPNDVKASTQGAVKK